MRFLNGLQQHGDVGGGFAFVKAGHIPDDFEGEGHILDGGGLLFVQQVGKVRQQFEFNRFQQVRLVLLICVEVAGVFKEVDKLVDVDVDDLAGRVHPLRNFLVREFLADAELEGTGVIELLALAGDGEGEFGDICFRDDSIIWVESGIHWKRVAAFCFSLWEPGRVAYP